MTCSVKKEIEKELDGGGVKKVNGVYQVPVPSNSNKRVVFHEASSIIRAINEKYTLPNVPNPIRLDKDKIPNAIAVIVSPHQALETAYQVKQKKATVAQVNSAVTPPKAHKVKAAGKVKIYPTAATETNLNVIKTHEELLKWKEKKLAELNGIIANLEKSLIGKENSKHHADIEKNDKLKALLKQRSNLQQVVKMLKNTKSYSLFSSIALDLNNMAESIESGDLHNIFIVQNQLAYYKNIKFTKKTGTDELSKSDNRRIDEIFSRMGELEAAIIDGQQAAINKLMSDDLLMKGALENINKDIELRRKFGGRLKEGGAKGGFDTVDKYNDEFASRFKVKKAEKLKKLKKRGRNRLSTAEETEIKNQIERELTTIDDYEEFVISDLLKVLNDISAVDSNLLGMISSNRGDTILPQFVYSLFLNHVTQNDNFIIDKINRLIAFNKKHKGLKRDPLFNLDENGKRDGDLIDAFTNMWYEFKQESLGDLIEELWNSRGTDSDQAYSNVIDWLNNNADVLDLYKLPEIHELYGGLLEHKDEFDKYSEAERKSYKAELQERLGPQYQIEVNKVKDAIAKYQRMATFKEDSARMIASSNIWEFAKLHKQGTKGKIEFVNSDNKQDFTYFSAFHNLAIIPKKNRAGFISDQFKEVINTPALSELWDIYRDMGEYINNSYAMSYHHKVKMPIVDNVLLDKIMRGFKKYNIFGVVTGGAQMIGDVQSFFYHQNNYRTDEEIISNYKDVAGRGINEYEQIYKMEGLPNPRAEAVKKIHELYYASLDSSFIAVLKAAALHQTRQEMAPIAKMIQGVYESIKIDGKYERLNGKSKMDYFLNHVVLNKPPVKEGARHEPWNKSVMHDFVKNMLEIMRLKNIPEIEKSKELKDYSDLDKELMKDIQIIAKQGLPAELSIDSTVNGIKFKLNSVSDGKKMVFTTNVKIDPLTVTVDESSETTVNEDATEVSEDEFTKAFYYYLEQKMKSLGNLITVDSFMTGWLSTAIIGGLAFKGVSGVTNRMEGILSNFIADIAGDTWTRGNYEVSKEFFGWGNLAGIRNSLFISIFGEEKASKYIHLASQQVVFRALMPRMGALQDKLDTLQKSAEAPGVRRGLLNSIYAMSVEHPEYKNQGEIHTNIMQDTVITDSEGNEYKFFDRKTMSFPALMMQDGVLVVRPEFKVTPNGGFSFDSKIMEVMVNKITVAVSRKQGNYAHYDIMKLKSDAIGKSFALFHTYLPEKYQTEAGQLLGQRKGELVVDLAGQQVKIPGYKSVLFQKSPATLYAYKLASMGLRSRVIPKIVGFAAAGSVLSTGGALATAVIGAPIVAIGAVSLGAILFSVTSLASKKDIKSEGLGIMKLCLFLEATMKSTWNFPITVASTALNVGGTKLSRRLTIKREFVNEEAVSLNKQEIASIRATAAELGARISMFLWRIFPMIFIFDDDDDEKSWKRKIYNFLDNFLMSCIDMSTSTADPAKLYKETVNTVIVRDLSVAYNAIAALSDNDTDKALEQFKKLSPVPKALLPSHYLPEYSIAKINQENWMADLKTDYETAGKSVDKNEYEKLRSKLREKVKDKYRGFVSSAKVLSDIADNAIADKYMDLEVIKAITGTESNEYKVANKLVAYLNKSLGENNSLQGNAESAVDLIIRLIPNVLVEDKDKDGTVYKNLYDETIPKGEEGKYITKDKLEEIIKFTFFKKE